MRNQITAVEIGQRCKKFRNARGLSQQALADMIRTTPQNISKYEKEGIYNIETIQELSTALGYNLMMDEVEQEGSIGEIGREILLILIAANGKIDFSELTECNRLYGLSNDRIIKELFKLEEIGLVVRELYSDIYGEERDRLFITAKGIISYKHLERESFDKDHRMEMGFWMFDELKSYENECHGFNSMQEYWDSKSKSPLLAKLDFVSGFRCNFVFYILQKYGYGNERLSEIVYRRRITGRNIYEDIINSMILETTRDQVDLIVSYYLADIKGKNLSRYMDLIAKDILGNNQIVEDFLFDKCMCGSKVDANMSMEMYRNKIFLEHPEKKEKISLYYELKELHDAREWLEDYNTMYTNFFENRESVQKEVVDFDKIFSVEEIKEYVDNNILSAANDEEVALEELLKEIIEQYPDVLDYFTFPSSWERNGLANYIRKKYFMDEVIMGEEEAVPRYNVIIQTGISRAGEHFRRIVDKESGAKIYDPPYYLDPEFHDATTIPEILQIGVKRCPGMKFVIDLEESFGINLLDYISEEELQKYIVEE